MACHDRSSPAPIPGCSSSSTSSSPSQSSPSASLWSAVAYWLIHLFISLCFDLLLLSELWVFSAAKWSFQFSNFKWFPWEHKRLGLWRSCQKLSVALCKNVIQKQWIAHKCLYFRRILNRVYFTNVRILSLCPECKQMTHCERIFQFSFLAWKHCGNSIREVFRCHTFIHSTVLHQWAGETCVCSHKVLVSFLTDQRKATFLCGGNVF